MAKWMTPRAWFRSRGVSLYVLLATSLALPAVLAVHSYLATGELAEMRSIILRERAASIAARLEVMPPAKLQRQDFEDLIDNEPGLVHLKVYTQGTFRDKNSAVEALLTGRSLYSAGPVTDGTLTVFRAHVPFHSSGQLNVAEIDLSPSAPDNVLVHGRHTLLVGIISGGVLLVLSLYAIWSTRRAAILETERLEIEGLAQVGRLSAVLAHEIRNPLGTIKGFAQLAREQGDERTAKPLDAIVRESGRLERLVNALLMFGKPLHPNMRLVEWDRIENELALHAREVIGQRTIRFSSDSQIRTLRTDPDLLEQVLLNLIRNSVEAIPATQEGEIRLVADAPSPGTTIISVEDNGTGIPHDVRSKLFAPFRTTKASGTGLGLAISKRVVETLGGTLRFGSVVPHGTKAEVILHGTNSGD